MSPSRFKPMVVVGTLVFALWTQAQTTNDSQKAHKSEQTATVPPTAPDSTKLEPINIVRATYPSQAAERGLQGEVVLKMHVTETGDVESVDLISGDPVLAESAIDAAKKWKFKPFIKNGQAIKVATTLPFDFYFKDKLMKKGVSADWTATTEKSTLGAAPGRTPLAASDKAAAIDPSTTTNRVHIGQGVSQGFLIHQVAPVYPPVARANHVQGSVVLRAVIGKDGHIANLNAVSGPPELIPAAMGAVQQWRYKPYLLKGEPVEVDTLVTINFFLH